MLRFKIDLGQLDQVERSDEKRKIIPLMAAPAKKSFRNENELGKIVAEMQGMKHVELSAGTGMGKSVKVPLALAKLRGCLVIHTVPFWLAAQRIADYVGQGVDAHSVVYIGDNDKDVAYPSSGVVLTSNAALFDRVVSKTLGHGNGAVLYLDEVHESDCWTGVVRTTAPAMSEFSTVIRASASTELGRNPKHKLTHEVRKYNPQDPVTWSSRDEKQPWGLSHITQNTWIFLEHEETVQRLAGEYADAGITVVRLSSQTTKEQFDNLESKLVDHNGELVVVFAPYCYRSSFTVKGVSNWIDSGEVAVPKVEAGRPVVTYRRAYQFEIDQAVGRAGRVGSGLHLVWIPNVRYETKMCDLEQVEADAANLLIRLLGFRPPLDMKAFAYYDGPVPKDISAALLSDSPVRLCPPEMLVPWANTAASPPSGDEAEYEYQNGHRRLRSTVSDASSEISLIDVVRPGYHDHMTANLDGTYRPRRLSNSRRAAKLEIEKEAAMDEVKSRAAAVGTVELFDMPSADDFAAAPPTPVSLDAMVGGTAELQGKLKSFVKSERADYVPGDTVVSYLVYHGMTDAPLESLYFPKGLESVLRMASEPDMRAAAAVLPRRDKLYAMKVLVEEHNEQMANAMAIQRMTAEMQSRGVESWATMVDPKEMTDHVQHVMERMGRSVLRVKSARAAMTVFAEYSLIKIPAASGLEEAIMTELAHELEDKCFLKVKPNEAVEYFDTFNDVSKNRVSRLMGIGAKPVQRSDTKMLRSKFDME